MIVATFPCAGKPKYGIFNLRSVRVLQTVANVKVIHLRSWLPGRPLEEDSIVDGVPVKTLAVPQAPWGDSLNILTYEYMGWQHVRSELESCEVIHSVGTQSAIIASAWARRAKRHHVFQATGSDVNIWFPIIRNSYAARTWHTNLHGVACNSTALVEGFLSLYPGSKNVRPIWRGVDLVQFASSGPRIGALANKTPVRFIYMGGFASAPTAARDNKGGETLMSAWQRAERTLHAAGASLLIMGCEPNNVRVHQWREQLRHPENVHLSSFTPPETIPAYIRSADVVLVPSLQEGLPNVAVEASACGRPVFGSDIGGMRDVVVHEQTGLLIRPGDVEAWHEALCSNADRADHLKELGSRARLHVERLFDCKEYAGKMLQLYDLAMREPLDS
jgi:glycosyltransferase involved in cell wall biosynthesis